VLRGGSLGREREAIYCALSRRCNKVGAVRAGFEGGCSIYVTIQLIPCKRILEYFEEQMAIRVSEGSLYNFNQGTCEYLKAFEWKSKAELSKLDVLQCG
jgi:hypothetical protein